MTFWVSRDDDGFPSGVTCGGLHVGGQMDVLLHRPVLSVVGSRKCSQAALDVACAVGRLAAERDWLLVSGDAVGVDRTAMNGAAVAGGRVVGVLPCRLHARLDQVDLTSRLVLCSPYDPESGWTNSQAFGRNKVLYQWGDVTLVVDCVEGRGGSWNGAVRALKGRLPVAVWRGEHEGPGNEALERAGAKPVRELGELVERVEGAGVAQTLW